MKKLYHFTSECNAKKIITDKRMKISRIESVNDPFEIIGIKLESIEERESFHEIIKKFSKKFGILCFSATYHNPIMWAHYADNHKGICLEFSVSDDYFEKIEYLSKRLPLEKLGIKRISKINENHIRTLLFKKYCGWRYENEHRKICSLAKGSDLKFNKNFQLTKVIIGKDSNLTREQVDNFLSDRAHEEVVRFKARVAFKTFQVVENKDPSLWK